MKRQVGLWIDHRQAVLVVLSDKGEKLRHLRSNVEKQLRRSGDSPLQGPYESLRVPVSDRRQKTFMGHLNGFYDRVLVGLAGAEAVLIMGPGEAKGELLKRLEKDRHPGPATVLETADKMTDHQVAAKTRRFYHVKRTNNNNRIQTR